MTQSLENDAQQLFALLFGIVLEGEKRLAEHLTAHDLSAPQFYVLKTLSEHDGRMAIGEIARQHGLTNATMTGIIKRMEASSVPLVARESNASDRRGVDVLLLPAGRLRLDAVQKAIIDQLRTVFSLFPEDERARLLTELNHYMGLVLATGR
ncbi:MAG: MarR family transcriptional regulator [Pleurocapsa minor GSE-CHR-MK-17-07R]|nr:MarR family transcriptional regulator [Pleurocapsa minor GSE-CHR-MK 17-07R]